MAKPNVRVIVGAVFAPVGLILLGVAAALSVSSAGFASTAERAEGTVLDLAYRYGAAYPYVTYVSPSDRRQWLREHGRECWANVDHIGQDFSVQFNGRSPFVIRASWRDERTGRTHAASSDHLWQYPDRELMSRPVCVLFDPADPDRNLIDLERSLPSRF